MRDSLSRDSLTRVIDDFIGDFFAVWQRMVAACPGSTWEERGGVVLLRTQIPAPPFNGVWQRADRVSVEEVLAAVDELAGEDLPWNVQLRPDYPRELDDAFAQRELTATADIPFMTTTALPERPTELAFRQVVTFDDVGEHVRLLEDAFSMPQDLTRRAFPMAMLFAEGTTTWLGSARGEVVTTALGVQVGDAVGVFNVATPEEHRGKGYGGAATTRAANGTGAARAFLQSSPLGEPVYRGLGFTTQEHWRQWMPKRYLG